MVVALALAPCSLSLAMAPAPKLPDIAVLQGKINTDLVKLDTELATAAKALSTTGLQGNDAARLLQSIYENNSSVATAATIGLDGTLLLIQPASFKNAEGENISSQSHFARLKKSQQPVMSGIFKTVEGFYAVSLIYPVFAANNKKVLGFVSVVFKPDALMRKSAQAYLADFSSVEVTAIEQDGLIIYDKDIQQIGRQTFSDPLYQSYTELLALANRMTSEATGTGTYSFPPRAGAAPIRKSSQWTTISLHGTDWRLILSQGVN